MCSYGESIHKFGAVNARGSSKLVGSRSNGQFQFRVVFRDVPLMLRQKAPVKISQRLQPRNLLYTSKTLDGRIRYGGLNERHLTVELGVLRRSKGRTQCRRRLADPCFAFQFRGTIKRQKLV